MLKEVLIILPSNSPGGAEKYLNTLVQYYSNLGFNIDVFFLKKNDTSSPFFLPKKNVRYFYTNQSREIFGLFEFLFKYLKFKKKRYEYSFTSHVHCNSLISIFRKNKLLLTNYLICRESTNIFLRFTGIKLLFFKIIYILGYSKSIDLLICQSELMKSQLLLNSGLSNFNNIKIQYIKNPITNNNSHFHNSSLNSEDIDKKSYFTILLVSRIVRIKNIILAIEAIRILKSMGFNYSLNIVGAIVDKVYFSELNNFIISHDLSNNIIFFGSRQDVNDLIVNSDICLLTSISEGFPNVILEYMQQNKPIISTKCFFNYENYKQIFFTENSGDEIASKILSLKNMKINSNYYKNILAEHSINSFIYNINKNLNIEDSNNRF